MRHWAYESEISDAEIARMNDKVESTNWLEVAESIFQMEDTKVDFVRPLNVTLDHYIRISNPKYKGLEFAFPFDKNSNGPRWSRPNAHQMDEFKGDEWGTLRCRIVEYIWDHRDQLPEKVVTRMVKRYYDYFRRFEGAEEIKYNENPAY